MSSGICALITGPTFAEAHQQLAQVAAQADLVEVRLDLFSDRSLAELKKLLDTSPVPVIVTLRKSSQGGKYPATEEERREEIRQILRLSPSYFDIEDDSSPHFLIEQFPEVSFVVSHHDFVSPAPPLQPLYETLQEGAYRKIARMVTTSTEALEMLLFAKDKEDLILIGMGEQGSVSRILAPVFDIPWCYAPIGTHTAPGQIPLETLIETYRYPELSPSTKLYGLIGDPVSKSISEYTHNALFKELGVDAVYVKMGVTPEELPRFLPKALEAGFQGLSVTTPLKEMVLEHLIDISTEGVAIKGINTLIAQQQGYAGINTDAPGALNAIERHLPVQGKTILLLGAGPAARAIECEAKKRGATPITTHRDEMENLPPYDILINATPVPMPIREEQILPGTLVMETNVKPLVSPFLEAALRQKCSIIYGEEMFIEQAVLQFEAWGYGQAETLYPLLSKIAMRRRLTETRA